MARYSKVFKSMAHNAVGNRRIEALIPPGNSNNYYTTSYSFGTDSKITGSMGGGGSAWSGTALTTFTPETTFTTGAVFGGNATAGGYIKFLPDTDLSTKYTILQAGTSTEDQTYTLPLAYPVDTTDKYLVASTAGVMSWVAAAAAGDITGGGTDTYVTYWDGTSSVTGTAGLTYDADVLSLSSATANLPKISLTNTNADNSAPLLDFIKDSASPLASDDLAGIRFYGDDDNGDQNTFARIDVESPVILSGSYDGSIKFRTAAGGTDNTGVMILSGSNVGIGTISPDDLLTLSGSSDTLSLKSATNIKLDNTNNNNPWYFGNIGTNAASLAWTYGGATAMMLDGNKRLTLGTDSEIASARYTIIDTSNPQMTLAYNGSNYTTFQVATGGDTVLQAKTGYLSLKTDTAGEYVRVDSKGDFRVDLGDSAGTYGMRVRAADGTGLLYAVSDGPVGIGTESNTTEALWITDEASPDADTNLILQQGTGGGGGYLLYNSSAAIAGAFAINSSSNMQVYNYVQDKDIIFSVNDGGSQTEVMRVDGSVSRVGIGTAAPDYQLDVRKVGYEVMLVSGQSNGNYPVAHFIDSTDQWPAWFEGNRGGDPGAGIRLWHNPSSGNTNNNTYIQFCMNDVAGARNNYAMIKAGIDIATAGAEGGHLAFQTCKAASLTEAMRIDDAQNVGIGTTTPSSTLNVLGATTLKASTTVGSATQTGSGLDDMTSQGTFVGLNTDLDYRVKIDATGTPDTFTWSDDGGSTWDATGVSITASAQALNNGVTVTFGATTGHTLNDYWDFSTTTENPLLLEDESGNDLVFVGNDGKVGIGTSSPGFPLVVSGNQYDLVQFVGADEAGVALDLDANGTNGANWRLQSTAAGAGAGAGKLTFAEDGNIRMTLEGGGDVGIGTTSPSNKLHVATTDDQVATFESTNDRARIRLLDNDTTNYIVSKNSFLSLGANNSLNAGNLNIEDDGKVGIGTIAPTANFQVTQGTAGVGTVTITSTTTCTGVGTQFENTFKVGDSIIITDTAETREITAIDSNTVMTIAAATNTAGSAYTLAGGDRFSVLGNGNVGIGTNTPEYTLDVVHHEASTYAAKIYNNSNTGKALWSKGGIRLEDNGYSKWWDISSDSAANFGLKNTAGSTLFYLLSGGNLGLGTDAPDRKLHLSSAGTTFMEFTSDNSNDFSIGANSTAGFTVYDETDSKYRFSIDEDGLVGINTTSMSDLLTVQGDDNSSTQVGVYSYSATNDKTAKLFLNKSANSTAGSHTAVADGDYLGLLGFRGSDGDSFELGAQIRAEGTEDWSATARGTDLIFSTVDNTTTTLDDRMIINQAGNVGIGTTSPTNALSVWKAINNDFVAELKNTHDTAGQSWGLQVCAGTNSSDAALVVENEAEDTSLFYVRGDGNVGIGTTSPTAKLQLQGDSTYFSILAADGSEGVSLGTASSGRGIFYLKGATGGNAIYIDSNGDSYFDGGDVGIGTTSPTTKLDIRSTDGFAIYATIDSTATIASDTTNNHAIRIKNEDDTDASTALLGFQLYGGYQGAFVGMEQWVNGGGADTYGNLVFGTKAIGGTAPIRALTIDSSQNATFVGTVSATAKSFNIEHPLYKDKRLVHGSLEGPEHGIYLRGSIEATGECLIELPDYWEAMCDDYTVQLTPHGPYTVFIKEKQKGKVMVECYTRRSSYKFDYYIVGARTDQTLEVVQDG